jgi:hypothetical protein
MDQGLFVLLYFVLYKYRPGAPFPGPDVDVDLPESASIGCYWGCSVLAAQCILYKYNVEVRGT